MTKCLLMNWYVSQEIKIADGKIGWILKNVMEVI